MRFVASGIAAITVSLLTFSSSPSALADEPARPPSHWVTRPLALEAHFAPTGGPWGVGAATVDYTVVPWLALTAGVGHGVDVGNGMRYGAGVRGQALRGPGLMLGGGASFSAGDYRRVCFQMGGGGCDSSPTYPGAMWVNADFQIGARFSGGFTLRGYAGFSQLVASDGMRGTSASGKTEPGAKGRRYPILHYVGGACGFAF